jgi:hypothetical protein
MKNLIFILILSPILTYYLPTGYHNYSLTTFAFGSCYRGFFSMRYDIFKQVNKNNPQLFLWLGDAAYVHNVTIIDDFDEAFAVNLYKENWEDECKYIYFYI